MNKYWTDTFSYVTGVVRYKDLAYLSLIGDVESKQKIRQSILTEWDAGEWVGNEETDKTWDTVAATIAKKPLEQALFLGENGEIFCIGSGDYHDEKVLRDKSESRGPFRGIRGIGNSIYVVGMNRQVYQRNSKGNWSCIDQQIRPPSNYKEVVGLESIDGFNESDIYTVGWDGEIWQYDGCNWDQKDSPTNFLLVNVCCAGDGYVYACGLAGNLIRGKGDSWEVICHDLITDDFWDLAWFKGELFLSTMDAIYILEKDDSLSVIEMGEDKPDTCFHLSTADGVLWSIGAKDVMAYDGNNWMRID